MKRHIIAALVIGLVAGGLVLGLELSGLLLRVEGAVSALLPESTTRVMTAVQGGVAFIVAAGIAFLTLAGSRRARMGLIVAILFVEIAGIAWVSSLYKVEFQPLPAMTAAVLGYLASLLFIWFEAYLEERRSRPPKI